jgi:Domain of unknown function (DUF4388)
MVQDLRGSIQEGALANLLQYLSLNQASGCLNIEGPRNALGKVYLVQGRVVHAATSRGGWAVPALEEMIGWAEGAFRFRNGETSADLTIDVPLERLLLNASISTDESRRAGTQTPTALKAGTVLKLRALDQLESTIELPVIAASLLSVIDGKRSLEQAANALKMPLEQVLEIAGRVVQIGLAAPASAPRAAQGFVTELVACVVRILGPVGEIVVEDALEDIGVNGSELPLESVNDLMKTIGAQFKTDQQRALFNAASREVRSKYKC